MRQQARTDRQTKDFSPLSPSFIFKHWQARTFLWPGMALVYLSLPPFCQFDPRLTYPHTSPTMGPCLLPSVCMPFAVCIVCHAPILLWHVTLFELPRLTPVPATTAWQTCPATILTILHSICTSRPALPSLLVLVRHTVGVVVDFRVLPALVVLCMNLLPCVSSLVRTGQDRTDRRKDMTWCGDPSVLLKRTGDRD